MSFKYLYKSRASKKRIAGCISLEDDASPFGTERHHSLTLVGKDFTAVENAIYYCALFGCESIWITVEDSWAPIIKKRVSDYIHDPTYFNQSKVTYAHKSMLRRYIPIYFVPTLPQHRKYNKSIHWGIINSAIYARQMGKSVSYHNIPNLYFACSPYHLIMPKYIREVRRQSHVGKKRFYFACGHKSYKTNYLLPFTFNNDDIKNILEHAREKRVTKTYFENGHSKVRRNADTFHISDMDMNFFFSPMEDNEEIQVDKYWNIWTWRGYKELISEKFHIYKPDVYKRIKKMKGMEKTYFV